jgi:hypothetical protein
MCPPDSASLLTTSGGPRGVAPMREVNAFLKSLHIEICNLLNSLFLKYVARTLQQLLNGYVIHSYFTFVALNLSMQSRIISRLVINIHFFQIHYVIFICISNTKKIEIAIVCSVFILFD